MRRPLIISLATLVALTLLATAVLAAPPQPRNFTTALSGGEEVADPPVVTRARGAAHFQLSDDGTELSYRLIAANIENVHMAHIHIGARGENGPVVVWLYPSTTPGPGAPDAGRHDGVLATGTITAANLVGPLAGQPLSELVDHLVAGTAYVNVHTLSTQLPDDTAGNYPAGEIRGQLD